MHEVEPAAGAAVERRDEAWACALLSLASVLEAARAGAPESAAEAMALRVRLGPLMDAPGDAAP